MMRRPQAVLFIIVIAADVLATLCAFFAAIRRPKTVNLADCGEKIFGPTTVYGLAWVAAICLIISLICSVTYYIRIRIDLITILVILFIGVWSLVTGLFLYLGLIYKKKMDGVCEIAHPAFLYLTAVYFVVHGILFCASLTCIGEEGEGTTLSSGGVQLVNMSKGKILDKP